MEKSMYMDLLLCLTSDTCRSFKLEVMEVRLDQTLREPPWLLL